MKHDIKNHAKDLKNCNIIKNKIKIKGIELYLEEIKIFSYPYIIIFIENDNVRKKEIIRKFCKNEKIFITSNGNNHLDETDKLKYK